MTTLTDITSQLKSSLLDAASRFADGDFARHVQTAVKDFSRYRPLEVVDTINLQAGTALYPCPDGLTKLIGCDWGRDFKQTHQPWNDLWPGRLPEIRLTRDSTGVRMLYLTPAPTALQINTLGSGCPYRYGIPHQVDAGISTLLDADVPLVLVRSQAEALRELAMQHTTKPYQVRDGISSTPRNGTPAFLYKVLMEEFERRVLQ